MMQHRSFSIRDILLCIVSLLTMLIVLLSTQEVFTQWQQLRQVQSLKQATLLSDELFDAAEKSSVERDITFFILHAPDKETLESLRPRLESSRQETDAALQNAFSALGQYNVDGLYAVASKSQAQWRSIQELRAHVDSAIALPSFKRDHALAEEWFTQSSALIAQTQEVWLQFIQHFITIDPTVTLLMRFKYYLGTITEFSGRQRSLIGKLIVENADPTPPEQSNLLRWQGMIELSWGSCDTLIAESGLSSAINPYLKDAQSHYVTLYDMVRDIFFVPGAKHSASYVITITQWFDLATETTDSLYALKDVALRETHRYMDTLEHRAQRAIMMHLLLLGFALIVCGYSFRMIIRRVIRPINAMVEALINTTQGKPVPFIPQAIGRQDEIGKLADVLHAFRETSERYRALVEASTQITWTWRPGETGDLDAYKDWWQKITGQPRDEILPFGWLKYVHPEDRENAKDTWAKASVEGKNFEMEYRVLALHGPYRWAYFRGVAIKNPDGSVREFVGSLNDITESKTAEAELMAYMQALEHSNKELDDFAYIASHDLKEPLRGIHNHSCFLLEDNEGKLDPESVKKLGRLVYLSQRMERLVNDLLYFSRLGRQELAIQSTNLNDVIADIESMLEIFLHDHHARIVIPKPLPIITCDKPRITEAFRNLITNAIKYNDKPEKMVEIGFLDHMASPSGEMLHDVFYVKDNGKGIPPEFYEEIFRIFKRLQSSKDSPEEGTGVGLTFVKKIIERHGGKIWLTSEVGVGTTFYFTLVEKLTTGKP